jgi:PLP dependent protein
LSRGAEAAGRELGCLVQIDFDPRSSESGSGGRSGAAPADVDALAAEIDGLPHVRLDGVMTVAPLGVDPRPVFDELVALSERLQSSHPGADVVSAGMSEDFEAAVAAGATHLRLGRSILGERPPLR